MGDGIVPRADERLEAREVIQEARIVGMFAKPLFDRPPRARIVSASPGRDRSRDPLPRRDLGAAGSTANRKGGRIRLRGDRSSPRRRVPDEDDSADRRVELLAGDREARGAADNNVDLLVVTGACAELVVLFDQLVSGALGPVGVYAERRDT